MSYPAAGFPDYSRLNPNGGRYLGTLTGVINTDPITPWISTTGFGYLNLLTNSNSVASDYEVLVQFAQLGGPGTTNAEYFYIPSNDNFNAVQIPILGQWFRVAHSYDRGPGTEQPSTYIYGTNAQITGPLFGGFGSQSILTSANVTHGGSSTFGMLGIAPGPATFSVSSVSAMNWYAQLQHYDAVIAQWLTTYQISGANTANQVNITVNLLPMPVRVLVFNNETTTQSFSVSLIPGG